MKRPNSMPAMGITPNHARSPRKGPSGPEVQPPRGKRLLAELRKSAGANWPGAVWSDDPWAWLGLRLGQVATIDAPVGQEEGNG